MSKSTIKNDIAKIKSEIQKWHNQLNDLQQEKSSYETQIKELENMPVNRADFGILLKESIYQQANFYRQNIAKKLLKRQYIDEEQQVNYGGFEAMNKRAFGDFERCQNTVNFEWIFNPYRSHTNILTPQNSTETRQMLCWLMPNVVYDKIMQIVNDEIGDSWGNDDVLGIDERRQLIAKLKEKIVLCQNRINELTAVIDEMGLITNRP